MCHQRIFERLGRYRGWLRRCAFYGINGPSVLLQVQEGARSKYLEGHLQVSNFNVQEIVQHALEGCSGELHAGAWERARALEAL